MFEVHKETFEAGVESEIEIDALNRLNTAFTAPHACVANPGFQLPKPVWTAMLGSYAIFFGAIFAATGGSGHAVFAIIVSVLYTAAYFGIARIGARQAGAEAPSPLERGEALQTWTGPMDAHAVYGQVLIVPVSIAIFGLAILVITAVL